MAAALAVCLTNCTKDDCTAVYPEPEIEYDRTDADGRVYIPVTNWSAYADEMFREAPELPPCGSNTNSSRTWVDIYDAENDTRIYGFCGFNSNDDLKSIWFKPSAPNGKVYIIINDRACGKTYKSNTIPFGECAETYPAPEIKYDRTDADGRVYIPVVNWSAYPNELFRQAPELPPCGLNANSSRTWIGIYNAANDARIYGFCGFDSNDDLEKIWFKPSTSSGKVYIIIDDRACGKEYKSNAISF